MQMTKKNTLMKEKENSTCLDQSLVANVAYQPRIGERMQLTQTSIGEIFNLINSIADQVYVVSGKRIEFESQMQELGTNNIADDLLIIEHNVRWISNNLRTCVETLGDSL